MPKARTIRYLKNADIDKQKWDLCIERSGNGLIYARSCYLDTMCIQWDGLVFENYESVMPLTWKSKWTFRYLYSVPFIQQTGIVGHCCAEEVDRALQLIYKEFRYGDIYFNYLNPVHHINGVLSKTNFILDLAQPFHELEKNFSYHLKRNLRKADVQNLTVTEEVSANIIIDLYQRYYEDKAANITRIDFIRLLQLYILLKDKKMAFTRAVKNIAGTVVAAALFVKDEKRIYTILNAITPEGRQSRANHFLFMSVIEEYSGQQLTFDFEGSDLPGVFRFYQDFGPTLQPFFHYHFNKLPYPFRLLKK